jgi:FkbM family methyltransferase
MTKLLIEVGAFDGHDSLQFHSEGYTVYTFEPKKDLYEALVNKTQHLGNYHVFPKAVCLENGTTTFNICRQGGASSILPFRSDEELLKTWRAHRTDVQYSGESYQVETTRLDTFIEEQGLQDATIDYLHIDAQGVDLDVLKSLGKYIKNIRRGVVETVADVNKSIYLNQENNTLQRVEEFLGEHGFIVERVEGNDNTDCEYNVYFCAAAA